MSARVFDNVLLAGTSASTGTGTGTRWRISVGAGGVACEPAAPGEPDADAAWVALPPLHNLHAHMDRAFTAPRERPRSLGDAVAASAEARRRFTAADVRARAGLFLERSLAHGVTHVRTHTDVDPVVEWRSMEGVMEAREAFAGLVDVDIIAFATARNDLAEEASRARLREAARMGVAYIGAAPALSVDPPRALDAALDLAAELGLPLDVHLDEHLDPSAALALKLAEGAAVRGLQGRVTLSHGCASAMLDAAALARLIEALAGAQVTVVALPETNLFLQDRGEAAPRLRGIAMLRDMLAAGIAVRFATDNVRDWFYPFGDCDMLTAGLIGALGAHIDDEAQLTACLCGGVTALAPERLDDCVLVPAASFDDMLARRPSGRAVIRAGRLVAG